MSYILPFIKIHARNFFVLFCQKNTSTARDYFKIAESIYNKLGFISFPHEISWESDENGEFLANEKS